MLRTEEQRPLLLLAAGAGSRMGMPKGLLEMNGRVWLLEQLHRFARAGGREAIVVLGHSAEKYFTAVPALPRAEGEVAELEGLRVRVALNARPELGQFSSIQAGGHHAAGSGAFVLPVDVPCPDRAILDGLKRELAPGVDAVMPEWQGHGGHPVLLAPEFVARLLRVPAEAPDARLDFQLRALAPQARRRMPVSDPIVCMNMNTPEELNTCLSRIS